LNIRPAIDGGLLRGCRIHARSPDCVWRATRTQAFWWRRKRRDSLLEEDRNGLSSTPTSKWNRHLLMNSHTAIEMKWDLIVGGDESNSISNQSWQ